MRLGGFEAQNIIQFCNLLLGKHVKQDEVSRVNRMPQKIKYSSNDKGNLDQLIVKGEVTKLFPWSDTLFSKKRSPIENDATFSLLKDVLKSVTVKPILVAISNLDSARMKIASISVELEVPVVIYGFSGIEDHDIKFSTTRSHMYVIIPDNTDVDTHIRVIKEIKDKDYTGKVLLILDKGAKNHKIMEEILSLGFYEIYFASPLGGSTNFGYEIKEICAYCNDGSNSVNAINYWKSEEGFRYKLEFLSSFKGNLCGANVKVAMNFNIGAIFKEGEKYYGMEYYLLLDIMKRLNFKIQFVHPKTYSWGSYTDGRWTGIIGMVYYHEADIGVGKVSITSSRFTAVNPTSLVETETYVMMSRKPGKSPRWQAVFEALTYEVWVVLMLSLFIVGLNHYFCSRFIPGEIPIKLSDALFAPLQILCIEPWKFRYPGGATLILYTGWMLSCMLITSFYVGSMQSVLMKPKYSEKPVDTVEELRASHHTLLLQKDTSETNFILPTYNLFDHTQLFTSEDDMQMVLNNPKYLSMADRNNIFEKAIMELHAMGWDPFHYGTDELYLAINSWVVNKNCPFRDDISNALLDAHRFGFLIHYTDKMAFKLKHNVLETYGKKFKETYVDVIIITMTYAWQIIKIYLLMNAFCILVITLEICFHKITTYCQIRKYEESLKEDAWQR